MILGIRELNVTWTEFKDLFDNAGLNCTIYYAQSGASPNTYIAFMATQLYHIKTNIVVSADVTDFEGNYQSGATSSDTPDGALARAHAALWTCDDDIGGGNIVPADEGDMIYEIGFTTSPGPAKFTIHSYAVTTGTTFYLMRYSINRNENSNSKGIVTMEVDGAIRDSAHIDTASAQGQGLLQYNPGSPIPWATSGEVVEMTMDEDGGGGGTDYAAVLIGFEVVD